MAKGKQKRAKAPSAETARRRDEARRRAAEQRRAREESERRRKELLGRIRKIALPAAAVVAVFAAALLLVRPAPEVPGVSRVERVEGEALDAGAAFDYGTPTPSSGPYAPGEPMCGVYTEPLALEEAVAALRVGAVVIWYRPGEDAPDPALAAHVGGVESHVVLAPNPRLNAPIVATALLREKSYESATELIDDDFAGTYRLQRADEEAACPMREG
jgi:hypothetical protein